MYKTRNKGTGNGMRGTRGIGGILYSGECRQTFRGMYSNIPRNVFQHSGESHQRFRGISPNIPGNPNIPGHVVKHSGECWQTFFYIYIYMYINESMDIYKRNRNLESSWIYHNNIVKLRRRLKRDCVNSTSFKILQW